MADMDIGGIEELGLADDLVSGRKVRADRRFALGLGSSTLGAAGAFTLTGTPTLTFRPDRLVLVDSVANNSTISSIKAGNVDQVIGGSGPAAAFSATAIGTSLKGQTVNANTPVTVSGTMAAAGTISGWLIGAALQ